MFKLTVLFLAYILVVNIAKSAQVSEIGALVKSSVEDCKSELKPNADDAKILELWNTMPKNEAQSCLAECYATKTNMMKDGKLNLAAFMKMIEFGLGENFRGKETKVEQIFFKCQQEVEKKSKEKCGAGSATRSCWIEISNL